LTHIKAQQNKQEQFKFQEVQDAMASGLEKNKKDWLTPEFFEKLSKSPRLMQAF
jgi:hypothetical protein